MTTTRAPAPPAPPVRSPSGGEARVLAGLDGDARLGLRDHLRLHGPLAPLLGAPIGGDELVAEVVRAGLTGRGGGGFPTGAKLASVRNQARRPLVVVNAMEGEPASRKDAVLALRAPHLVLDGAELAAAALKVRTVRVCVPNERPDVARSYHRAIGERRSAGVGVGAEVAVALVPGGYVAGEESALASWLDRQVGRPTFRPDRSRAPRVRGVPALVDNAETLAHLALIGRHGAAWFRRVGTSEAPGTALVTVSGAVAAPGVLEVPLGAPLRAVLAAAGAQPTPGAVLLGGYGGTWLGPEDGEVRLEPRALADVGCSLGAGVIGVLPPGCCGLAETARVARWMAGESAGQCGPCAFGLPAVADDLAELAWGAAHPATLARLRRRLGLVEGRGACRHPDGVARLVRSALAVFAGDVDHHLRHGPCRDASAPGVLHVPRHRREGAVRQPHQGRP